ncbi:bifunctional 4-hydroxy-2-oxoglutarate aldolase/2-dehydro-3-deoxy-phosphogluconate aldolase, partial [candidate division KSB1 bacterium]|nr:bifunctional 4-hydroxy-2-oxoglutarate aldolase/2-dehydro-3-deoxy-phosphogluconate aldolase [candidate division KSB1 bacterium]
MDSLLERLRELRVIPVVAINQAADAADLGQALVAGGLPCAEITFRTAAAPESIETLAKRGDMLVGAGTVLSIEQVKTAVDSGAQFIVSPGFNPKVVGYCVENNIPVTPGTATPTDIEQALGFNLPVVKFFPAEAFGGLKTLKAISAPYRNMRFIPTGGISAANLRDYLAFSQVWACGGSWMVQSALIQAHD